MILAFALAAVVAAFSSVPTAAQVGTSADYSPTIRSGEYSDTVDNPFLPFRPGSRWVYVADTPDGTERTVVRVTSRSKTILGVRCVVVRDTVRLDGSVIENTFDWYAQHEDGTVWYFGEATKEYENGRVVSRAGSWEAGVDGAQPGIVMPGVPRVGKTYRQEYYRGEAEDEATVLSVTESVSVPFGTYDGVVETKDFTPLDKKVVEHKYYASGVGLVLEITVRGGSEHVELVEYRAS
jgi:hypothetical protein